ncbi:MAG TPA: DNA polymerase III subunit gamma/tau [Gemmatimonadetes bacterium]|nr:DNA polymerase III subunit gamma/tau [Gemmatimonadota bacterium]
MSVPYGGAGEEPWYSPWERARRRHFQRGNVLTHIALARKYRPRSFAEVATQEHVSDTLRSAVSGGRVGHAYLFCGPRGVGKTTLARVLAMALNCPERSAEGEPCGVCESCARIWGGHTALDVVEIDAASNRGVDDARDLRERAMYAPSGDGYKIYIVDEAHMLTREAWNALLKILEEPPPRVIFVFATTEPQKIEQSAAPILSRCQRFDFRRIGVSDIVSRLAAVLAQEGAAGPEDALRMIARKADGGMRDALSMLDQVISLTGGDIEADSVRRVLGLVEEQRYLELLDILADGRHADVFTLVERLADDGYDLVEFYHGLLDVLRMLLRLRLTPETPLDLPDELRSDFASRAEAFEAADLVRMLAAAADLESQGSLRRSPNPRVLIEMLLLRLSYLDRTIALEQLISALGGAPPPTGGAGGGGGSITTISHNVKPDVDDSKAQDTLDLAKKVYVRSQGAESNGLARAATEGGDGTVPSQHIEQAWLSWLDAAKTVPRGLSAFLRSSTVCELSDGRIEVTPPPGPATERLRTSAVLAEVRRGLEPYLGRVPDLVLGSPAETAPEAMRVTEEEVRGNTLSALFRQEPRLREAVEELDLELMD